MYVLSTENEPLSSSPACPVMVTPRGWQRQEGRDEKMVALMVHGDDDDDAVDDDDDDRRR